MLEIATADRENVIALLDGRVMVQLRHGRLSVEVIDRVAARLGDISAASLRDAIATL